MRGWRFTQRAIERVAESRIRQAMAEGAFDGLPGRACIPHRVPTAPPDAPESAGLGSVGHPRRTSSTPAVPSVAKPHIFRHLRRLATGPGEKCTLGHPIAGIDEPYEPLWWVRSWIRREKLGEVARLALLQREPGP